MNTQALVQMYKNGWTHAVVSGTLQLGVQRNTEILSRHHNAYLAQRAKDKQQGYSFVLNIGEYINSQKGV